MDRLFKGDGLDTGGFLRAIYGLDEKRGTLSHVRHYEIAGRTAPLAAPVARRIGDRRMDKNPDRDREEVPGRPAVSPENMRRQAEEGREQRAEEGRGDTATRLRLFVRRLFGRGE